MQMDAIGWPTLPQSAAMAVVIKGDNRHDQRPGRDKVCYYWADRLGTPRNFQIYYFAGLGVDRAHRRTRQQFRYWYFLSNGWSPGPGCPFFELLEIARAQLFGEATIIPAAPSFDQLASPYG